MYVKSGSRYIHGLRGRALVPEKKEGKKYSVFYSIINAVALSQKYEKKREKRSKSWREKEKAAAAAEFLHGNVKRLLFFSGSGSGIRMKY